MAIESTNQNDTVTDEDSRLVGLLDQYIAAMEQGEAESVDTFARRHAADDDTFREELIGCLEGVALIHAAVESARDDEVDLAQADPRKPASLDTTTPSQIGDYRLIREIGRGGMGVVYEAEEQALRRRVALKVLPFAAVLDQRQITRFRNEAQSAAGLHHTHIVPVYRIGQERGIHYYAMQYIEGRSLAQAIAGLRSELAMPTSPDATTQTVAGLALDTPDVLYQEAAASMPQSLGPTNRTSGFCRSAAQLAADAADALHHAHELGIVHRDIKPSNLLIDEQGKVWVADFGLARMQTDLGVTATGDIVGTLRYMSPEQARGRADQVDGRTDVYALGATLYELLTLRHAHPGNDRRRLLEALERTEPIAPRRLNPAIPPDLENIVLRAMEKDRAARYTSAAELRDDLQRFLEGRPTIARPATIAERATKWTRRHRRMVAAASMVLAIIAAVSIVSGLAVNSARKRAETALAQSEVHRARAERSLARALGVLDRFGTDLSDQLAATPGAEEVRSEALQNTLDYYRYFLSESDSDPRLQASAAKTRVHAAAVAERLGHVKEAQRLYADAAETLAEVVAQSPEDRDATAWYARCLTNDGLLLSEQGMTEKGKQKLNRAVSLRRGLSAEQPDNPEALSSLAAVLSDRASLAGRKPSAARRDLDEAIALLARVERIVPDEPAHTRRLAVAYNSLSSLLRTTEPNEAARAGDRAIELLRRLVDVDPTVDAYRDDLAIAYSNRGALAAEGARWAAAAEAYGEAAAELKRLSERAPLVPRRRSELAVALASCGFAQARADQAAASDESFAAAEATLRGLVESYPQTDRYRQSLAALMNNRGVALRDSERLNEAAVAFAKSVRLEEQRIRNSKQPSSTLLAVHYANHAQVLGKLGRFEEAARVESKRQALLASESAANESKRSPTDGKEN